MFLFPAAGAAVLILLFFILRPQAAGFGLSPEKERRFDRFAGILFLCIAFLNLLLPDAWGLRFEQVLFDELTPQRLHAVYRLLTSSLIAVLPVALMYPKKYLARFAVVIGILSFFLDLLDADLYLTYFLACPDSLFGAKMNWLMYSKVFRLGFFCLFESLKLLLAIRVFFKRKALLPVKGLKDAVCSVLMVFPLLLVNMQPSFPSQFINGTTGIVLKSINWVCIAWLVWVPVEITVLALIFRKRSYEDRYVLLLLMSIALLFRYSAFYRCSVPLDAGRFPLQLCNVACYLIPAAVFFKKKGLALFAATINAFGALAAILACDTPGDSGLFYILNVHYILEHNGIIVISLLIFILKIFPAVEKRDFRTVMKVLTHYTATIFVLGTLFNFLAGFIEDPGMLTCNYLFIFERDFATDLLPFLSIFFDIGFDIGPYSRISLSVVVAYAFLALTGWLLFLLYHAIFREKKTTVFER